jgi:hypothetical protein
MGAARNSFQTWVIAAMRSLGGTRALAMSAMLSTLTNMSSIRP